MTPIIAALNAKDSGLSYDGLEETSIVTAPILTALGERGILASALRKKKPRFPKRQGFSLSSTRQGFSLGMREFEDGLGKP